MNHIVREGPATDFHLFRRRLDQSAVGQEEIQRHVVRRTIRISNQLCNYAVIFLIDDSLARRQVLELEAFGRLYAARRKHTISPNDRYVFAAVIEVALQG